MLSSPFDVFGMLAQNMSPVTTFMSEYGGSLGTFVVFALLVRVGVKVVVGGSKSGGGKQENVSDKKGDSSDASDASDAGNGSGGEERDEEKRIEAEKQKEEEKRREQEQLKELFEMVFEKDDEKENNQKTQEEKEIEELGMKREDLEKLKEEYKALTIEITTLLEKGMTAEQTAKNLVSHSVDMVSTMDFLPLIEAMTLFLKKNEMSEKNTAVIGVDPQFEQRAALSALKRGDYETALDFLEHQGVDLMNKAASSRRADVCGPALEQAACVYRAIGVLARPLDAQRSFEALNKSKELEPENTVTEALIARAYYDSGKVKKAESIFERMTENENDGNYARQYAEHMVSQIRTQRTFQHAQRIREEYENRLGDVEGRQKIEQRETLQQRKKAEVMRANNRFFVAEEMRERDNEREFG